jgi:hypothetical protein
LVFLCSNWPTIPQVYVDGEFLGGSDILMSMHRVRFSAYMFCYNLSICCLKWCKLSQLCSLSYCVLLRPLILVRFFVRENSSLRSLCKRFIWEAPASLRLAMTLFFPTFVDSHHFCNGWFVSFCCVNVSLRFHFWTV